MSNLERILKDWRDWKATQLGKKNFQILYNSHIRQLLKGVAIDDLSPQHPAIKYKEELQGLIAEALADGEIVKSPLE